MLAAIRDWFARAGFVEVETPVRLRTPALELHIDAEPSGDHFLRTSPELHMKRLLAAGYERIYQLGPCFRNGERGDRHNPEYSMLEWYRAGSDYRALLDDTREMVRHAASCVRGDQVLIYDGHRVDLSSDWQEITVAEAFQRWAGWDPTACYDAERFEDDLVRCVEPNLPLDRPVFLIDYPAPAAALARLKPGNPAVAERWELYMGGLEIANAYSELVDAGEQRRRFEQCAAERRALGKPVYPIDEDFLAALEGGMPPSAGIALGIDRLVMLFTGITSLDDLLPFRDG
jgi:lysyl-tRNA synthetase class 2